MRIRRRLVVAGLAAAAAVAVASGAVYAWSLMDRTTGEITGSATSTAYRNTTGSMIKADG